LDEQDSWVFVPQPTQLTRNGTDVAELSGGDAKAEVDDFVGRELWRRWIADAFQVVGGQ
jgi:hypothetical protein